MHNISHKRARTEYGCTITKAICVHSAGYIQQTGGIYTWQRRSHKPTRFNQRVAKVSKTAKPRCTIWPIHHTAARTRGKPLTMRNTTLNKKNPGEFMPIHVSRQNLAVYLRCAGNAFGIHRSCLPQMEQRCATQNVCAANGASSCHALQTTHQHTCTPAKPRPWKDSTKTTK